MHFLTSLGIGRSCFLAAHAALEQVTELIDIGFQLDMHARHAFSSVGTGIPARSVDTSQNPSRENSQDIYVPLFVKRNQLGSPRNCHSIPIHTVPEAQTDLFECWCMPLHLPPSLHNQEEDNNNKGTRLNIHTILAAKMYHRSKLSCNFQCMVCLYFVINRN